MKNLILILFAVITSCSNDETPVIKNTHYWVNRHDAIPATMQGEWASITNKAEIALIVTDRYVMTKDFRIDREQDNTVKVNDSVLHMYQGGKFYALVLSDNHMAITADNDCYDTVVIFQPVRPIPESEQPINNNLN